MQVRNVVHYILEHLYFVSLAYQAACTDTDFALTASGHFVVMHFNYHAHFFQHITHGAADVLERIYRRHREVAALYTGTMTGIAFRINRVGIPCALLGIDCIARAVHVVVVANAVKNEEFIFWTEPGAVSDAG